MKTLKELREFCNKCNVRFEEHPIMKDLGLFHFEDGELVKDLVCVGYEFGMNNITGRKGNSEWQWVWFETITENPGENDNLWFRERYSMANGKSYKDINNRMAANETIERRMTA